MTYPADFWANFRTVMRSELSECLGITLPPYSQAAQQLASPADAGNNSGTAGTNDRPVTGDGQSISLLRVSAPLPLRNGCNGLATIHIATLDVREFPGVTPTGKLVLDLQWRSGIAGGRATIDIQHGSIIAVGGVQTISADVRFAPIFGSAVAGRVVDNAPPYIVQANKRVEANVHWRTSASPGKAMLALPSVATLAATATAWYRVPPQARSMIAWGAPATEFPTLLAEFATIDAAAGIVATTLNPFANGSPVGVQGIEFVRFTSVNAMTSVFPVFELEI